MKPMRDHEQQTNKLNLRGRTQYWYLLSTVGGSWLSKLRQTMAMAAQFEAHGGVKEVRQSLRLRLQVSRKCIYYV